MTKPAQGAEACHIDKFSSRICERGTLSCDVEHSAAPPAQTALTDRIDHIDDAGYVHWKEKK